MSASIRSIAYRYRSRGIVGISVPDNDGSGDDGELCSVRLESEVVCGKCDARRLAASIVPHDRRYRQIGRAHV